jgi:hypothetical protein
MAAMTDAALLEQTRLAIDALTTGGNSAYTISGRSVTKLDLPELWEQVALLESRIAQASRGRAGVVRFGRPSR